MIASVMGNLATMNAISREIAIIALVIAKVATMAATTTDGHAISDIVNSSFIATFAITDATKWVGRLEGRNDPDVSHKTL